MNVVRYAIAVGAIAVVLAVVVVSHLAADLGESAGSSVNAGLSALPTTIGRDAAIALVRGRVDNIQLRNSQSRTPVLKTQTHVLAFVGDAKMQRKTTPT